MTDRKGRQCSRLKLCSPVFMQLVQEIKLSYFFCIRKMKCQATVRSVHLGGYFWGRKGIPESHNVNKS